MSVCPNCGLPQDLCVCETIAKESQKITVALEKRKFGKNYTVIKGFGKGIDTSDLAKKMKKKFACGGTMKGDHIELQGDHRARMKPALKELGFPGETVEVR